MPTRIGKILLCAAVAATTAALSGTSSAQAAPAAPVMREVLTGGDSIAVLWRPAAGTSPKSYTVYRDDTAVATVAPPPAPTADNRRITTTARYVDTNVVRGTTYRYKVRMTAADDTVSGFSDVKSATHPPASDTTAVPNVTVDTTTPDWHPNWATPLNDGAAIIRTWYPKFADRLVRRGYEVPLSITLVNSASDGGGAQAKGSTIYVGNDALDGAVKHSADPAWMAGFQAVFLHEMTHLLQQYPNGFGVKWLGEGIAVWTTHQLFNDAEILTPAFTASQYYINGYEPGARFLEWLRASPTGVPWSAGAPARANVIYDLNQVAHNGTYDSSFFVNRTGRTPAALWSLMSGISGAADGRLLAATDGGLCLDDSLWSLDNNNPLQLGTCWDAEPQFVSSVPVTSGSAVVRIMLVGKCMDVKGGYDPADGTPVVIWDCVDGADWQYWRLDGDGTLRHNRSNKCVQPIGEVVANGIKLEVRTCHGSPAQHAQTWTRRLS